MAAVLMEAREAYDLGYYTQRLADPELLKQSLAVCMIQIPLLVVPVGGSRRGGYYPVPCLCFGLAVRDALRGRPGFPFVRVGWSVFSDHGCVVEWGERPPMPWWPGHDETTLGRFYGYSEDAIDQYTAAQHTRVPTTPPASCSVFSPERPLV
ncbi:DUF6302 family protein [Streptomyces sp. WAC 01529]|uniref:DUF6302 family protein n=1 Tax=Streptomyces sp. WAC 01529 TaxID=2203205 RepID=UPI0013DF1E06|nr:DUF6302 family protein [Streptomyces sp. WAC 01529]